MDAGRAQPRLVGEVLGEALGVAALAQVIQLVAHGIGELLDHLLQVLEDRRVDAARRQVRQVAQDLQIQLNLAGDAGLLDLDHHLAAIAQRGGVDLADRGAGQRRMVEAGEDALGRRAQLGLQQRRDLGVRHRRQAVLQRRERLDVGVRQDIGAGAEDLAQLDEGGAKLLQRQAQRLRAAARVERLGHGHGAAPHQQAEAVAREHRDDLPLPPQPAGLARLDHGRRGRRGGRDPLDAHRACTSPGIVPPRPGPGPGRPRSPCRGTSLARTAPRTSARGLDEVLAPQACA